MASSHSIYDIIIRYGDDDLESYRGLTRTEAVDLMRSLFRSMDYDEVTVQVQKRIPE